MRYKWCGYYNCFCDEVEEIADSEDDYCDFDCSDCDEQEEMSK